MIKFILFTLLSLTWLGQASAAEQMRVCQDDVDVFPWIIKSGLGMNNYMLGEVSKRMDVQFIIEPMPWKRCLAMVEKGQFDAAAVASFTLERMKVGRFPHNKLKKIDTNRRMSDEAYSLFILKKNVEKISWDGKQLSTLEKPVAAQMGHSSVDILKAMDIPVDDSDKRSDLLLRNLLIGNTSAALLNASQGRWLLKNPAFGDYIVELEPAVKERAGYLLVSHQYALKNPQLTERIWDEIAVVRESATYQRELLNKLNSAP